MEWRGEIEKAAERIGPHIRQTPTVALQGFGLDFPLEMKLEQLQHTGSFKARGAFNTLLSTEIPESGVVAASGGNHGAAVGYAASRLGQRAAIFVPEIAGSAKISLIERSGADVRVTPGAYADALEAARAYEAETGAGQIHAYDAVPTVVGQGTLMREWEAQGLEADTILIAVGGGGLISGSLAWLQGRRKIIAVEPQTCCALDAALEAGHPVDVKVAGIAANALGARRIGDICFDLASQYETPTVLVDDVAIHLAQVALWQEMRQFVEPAGATALAALISGAYTPKQGEKVAVLVCGANPQPDPMTD